MEAAIRATELSFQRAHHAVDLVQRAISAGSNPNVLCVARSDSKLFVAAKLIEEIWRSGDKQREIVFLVENEESTIVKPFLEAARNQSFLSVKAFFNYQSPVDENESSLTELDRGVTVTDGPSFMKILESGKVDTESLSLIVFDSCHLVLDKEHPFSGILRQIVNSGFRSVTKVVGLLDILLHHSCAQDLERFLTSIEQSFGCKADVSSDLLALNKYGEKASEEIASYSYIQTGNSLWKKCLGILQDTLFFLSDCRVNESLLPCVKFFNYLVSECCRVLLMFGILSAKLTAQVIIKEINKMEKHCSDCNMVLLLQFCRTQMKLIVSISNMGSFENFGQSVSELTAKLLNFLAKDFKPYGSTTDGVHCISNCQYSSYKEAQHLGSVSNSNLNQNSDMQYCDASVGLNTQKSLKDLQSSNNLNTQNPSDNPLCVILVPSTIIAKAINSLINKLSCSEKMYSFLKSGVVYGSDRHQTLNQDAGDSIMQSVQDGSINVLVATFTVEEELYVPRCSLVIRLGMPKLYKNYLNVKRKLRAAGAKFAVCMNEDEKVDSEKRYKDFKSIESILQERCPWFRPPCQEAADLFKGDILESYQPFGNEGPKVDLLSSISVVNRYCSKFPSMGVGSLLVTCSTEEKWTNNELQFLSTLYLPRNSPFYHPVKASVSLKRNEADEMTIMKTRIKADMYVALETCRQLHQAGELNQQLEPIMRYNTFHLTAENEQCEDEVADNGLGMPGSVKRNRVYKRKFASILEHNLPRAGEKCYLYSIKMTLSKPCNSERANRSRHIAHSSAALYCLGILSRRRLPKLPAMVIFDREGEVTVTVKECTHHSDSLTTEQISLIQRFSGYVFTEIVKPKSDLLASSLIFNPTAADFGYYTVLLEDTVTPINSGNTPSFLSRFNKSGKEIAFDFMNSLERSLGSFANPNDPPPPGMQDVELFRDSVVTTVYSDKRTHYYVADIKYDCSPADPFPNSEVAQTFSEYYQLRYSVDINSNQPLLDVDHVHTRFNYLIPRYQSIKGIEHTARCKDSKRSQRSKVFVVPELCSIHPVPGYLWRQICKLPTVFYRIDSLLVAEELRSSLARDLSKEAVNWPNEVPLPLLTFGDMMGEEIICHGETAEEGGVTDILCEKDKGKATPGKEEGPYHGEVINRVLVREDTASQLGLPNDSLCPDHPDLVSIKQSPSEEKEELLKKFDEFINGLEDQHLETDSSNNIPHCTSAMPSFNENTSAEHIKTADDDGRTSEDLEGDSVVRERESRRCHIHTMEAIIQPKHGSLLLGGSCETLSGQTDKAVSVSIWSDPHLSSLYQTCGPPVTMVLRALTPNSAGDVFSLERLEVYGDSFVKHAISSALFFRHPYENEGKLSFIRGLSVSNRQLFYLARRRGLPSFLFTNQFLPLVNWIPHGFYLNECDDPSVQCDCPLLLTPVESLQDMDEEEDETFLFKGRCSTGIGMTAEGPSGEGHTYKAQLSPHLHHRCSDKTVADATEALIGAYLSCFGPRGACHFMDWLGMDLTAPGLIEQALTKVEILAEDPSKKAAHSNPCFWTKTDDSIGTGHVYAAPDQDGMQIAEKHAPIPAAYEPQLAENPDNYDLFKKLESSLKYEFRDKSLLLQAFTHISLPRGYNTVHNSYEQLEFLGDALLDFLVTQHLFFYHRNLSPGEITDLRSAVVNNFSFAALAVRFGFPKLLRSLSPSLFRTVNKFATHLRERTEKQPHVNPDQVFSSVFVVPRENDDDDEVVDVEVPKPLGDLFEAVAGAVYVDCGQDIERVWQVYSPILQPSIEYYAKHPPLSPVRKLLEMMPCAVSFSPAEGTVNGKVKCILTVTGCGKFVGVGRNYRIAKSTAAQRALTVLQQRVSADNQ